MIHKFSQISMDYLPLTELTFFIFQCSVTCGFGVRQRQLKCGRRENNNKDVHIVASEYCQNLPWPTKDLSERCVKQLCPVMTKPYWYTSPLSKVRESVQIKKTLDLSQKISVVSVQLNLLFWEKNNKFWIPGTMIF